MPRRPRREILLLGLLAAAIAHCVAPQPMQPNGNPNIFPINRMPMGVSVAVNGDKKPPVPHDNGNNLTKAPKKLSVTVATNVGVDNTGIPPSSVSSDPISITKKPKKKENNPSGHAPAGTEPPEVIILITESPTWPPPSPVETTRRPKKHHSSKTHPPQVKPQGSESEDSDLIPQGSESEDSDLKPQGSDSRPDPDFSDSALCSDSCSTSGSSSNLPPKAPKDEPEPGQVHGVNVTSGSSSFHNNSDQKQTLPIAPSSDKEVEQSTPNGGTTKNKITSVGALLSPDGISNANTSSAAYYTMGTGSIIAIIGVIAGIVGVLVLFAVISRKKYSDDEDDESPPYRYKTELLAPTFIQNDSLPKRDSLESEPMSIYDESDESADRVPSLRTMGTKPLRYHGNFNTSVASSLESSGISESWSSVLGSECEYQASRNTRDTSLSAWSASTSGMSSQSAASRFQRSNWL